MASILSYAAGGDGRRGRHKRECLRNAVGHQLVAAGPPDQASRLWLCELFHRFERTYAELLALSSASQIYKGLDALEEHGLIEPLPSEVAVPEEQRQRKTHYRTRAEAVPAYRDWLLAQVSQERQQLELLALQVGALPAPDALLVIDRYEQYLLTERCSAPPTLDGAPPLAGRLTQQAEQLETGVALKWTTYARRELQASIDAQSPGR